MRIGDAERTVRGVRRAAAAGLAALWIAGGCGESQDPIAVYDDVAVGPNELVAELSYLLEEGESFSSLGLTPEAFLREYVRFQLLLEEAKGSFQGLTAGEQARFALYKEALVRDALIEELFVELPPPDEARVQERYDERAFDERSFTYVRCRSRAVADSMHAWILSGISFAGAATRARRDHEGAIEDGSLGFNRRGEMPPEWEAAAWELEPGEVSDVVGSPSGIYAVLRHDERRRTPMEVMRPFLESELRDQARAARRDAIDAQLLQEARFQVDSTTVTLVAERFASHRDSLVARGRDPSGVGLPPFSPEELSRRLFVVMGQPFTLEAFLAEIGQFDTGAWSPGREVALLHDIARRRALSVILQQVAAERGIYQRPEIQARLERKRSEFMMNALLREVWRGVGITDEELRERLRLQGETVPGEATIAQLRERVTRELQNERLQEFVDQIVSRHEIEIYPERFPAVLERFERERRAEATPAS